MIVNGDESSSRAECGETPNRLPDETPAPGVPGRPVPRPRRVRRSGGGRLITRQTEPPNGSG